MSPYLVTFCLAASCLLAIEASEQTRSRPIRLTELEEYIRRMDATDGFKTEFNSLPDATTQLKSWNLALLPQNVVKHRYPPPDDNLLTYDNTRVILYKTPGDPYSDFINANWIDSYNRRNTYIGTQCPIDSTIEDFYRMIWQYNVHEVVMLASPHDVEKNKCSRYFPEALGNATTYGGVAVELQRKEEHPDVVVRIYALRKGGVTRVLVHHHFISWPDLGVPQEPQQLLNLILKYRNSDTFTKAWPLTIHCSAGVGRTGTFILTDSMYDMAENEDYVDFLQHLWRIRNQRISLVEKPEQYALAHKVILAAYKQGLFDKNLEARNKAKYTVMTRNSPHAHGQPFGSDTVRRQRESSSNHPHSYSPSPPVEFHRNSLPAHTPYSYHPQPQAQAQTQHQPQSGTRKTNIVIIDPRIDNHEIVIKVSTDDQRCS